MRVLVTGPALRDPGGVSAYYHAVLPELRQGGDAFDYVEIGGTLRRGGPLSPLLDQWHLRGRLAATRPDLYLCNPSLDPKSFLRDGLFVRQAARRGIPVLVFFHGWREDFAAQVGRRWQWVFREGFGRANRFIVLASAFRAQLESWGVRSPVELGITAVSAELLQGFDAAAAFRAREAGGRPVRILFLARLERAKGIRETLEAFRQLCARGLPVELTVAGAGGAQADLDAFRAEHPAIAMRVHGVGDVRGERKRELFATHDVYCFPSHTEGMPGSVLEALAFGLPVVTTAVGGLKDLFQDGRMGRLLQSPRAEGVADALADLVVDGALRERIGRFNRDFALRNCVAEASAARLRAALRATLDN